MITHKVKNVSQNALKMFDFNVQNASSGLPVLNPSEVIDLALDNAPSLIFQSSEVLNAILSDKLVFVVGSTELDKSSSLDYYKSFGMSHIDLLMGGLPITRSYQAAYWHTGYKDSIKVDFMDEVDLNLGSMNYLSNPQWQLDNGELKYIGTVAREIVALTRISVRLESSNATNELFIKKGANEIGGKSVFYVRDNDLTVYHFAPVSIAKDEKIKAVMKKVSTSKKFYQIKEFSIVVI